MKYIVYYANGHIEAVNKINTTYCHMIKVGVIRSIVSIESEEVFIPDSESGFKRIPLPKYIES